MNFHNMQAKSESNGLMKHDFCFYPSKWCNSSFSSKKLKQYQCVYTSVSTQLLTYFLSCCHCCYGCRPWIHSAILNVGKREQRTGIKGFLFIRPDALAAMTGRWRCTPTSVQGEASACSLSASFTCHCWTLSDFPRSSPDHLFN